MDVAPQIVHASSVAIGDQAALIKGASGAGKSSLALQMIGLGAVLIADDRVVLTAESGIWVSCPPAIKGKIEARGLGILSVPAQGRARLAFVVDLDEEERDRLPPRRNVTILGSELPLFYRVDGIQFAPALVQLLRAGRSQ